MNKLKIDQQASIISALVEGNSIRSTERMTGVHRDTIMRLMLRVGDSCHNLMDQTMRNLPCRNIQVDEIWGYVGKKQRHIQSSDDPITTGDQWTYVALDSDTKLVLAYLVGKRNGANTNKFIDDLSSRLANRVQLSSDALKYYVTAAEASFGANVDYGQIVKSYEADAIGPGRYSPPYVIRADRECIKGNPNPALISTSHVERQNLTMRMSMRRFTRLTNAFSKKLENLKAAVSLHFAYYNFCRVHASLRVTPAMETGLTNRIWIINDLLMAIN